METLRQNLRLILIGLAVVALVGVVSYVGGCRSGSASGFDSGFADGYKKGLKDSSCEGGTHYRPFQQAR